VVHTVVGGGVCGVMGKKKRGRRRKKSGAGRGIDGRAEAATGAAGEDDGGGVDTSPDDAGSVDAEGAVVHTLVDVEDGGGMQAASSMCPPSHTDRAPTPPQTPQSAAQSVAGRAVRTSSVHSDVSSAGAAGLAGIHDMPPEVPGPAPVAERELKTDYKGERGVNWDMRTGGEVYVDQLGTWRLDWVCGELSGCAGGFVIAVIDVYLRICVYVPVYIYIYICVCVCLLAWMYIWMYTYVCVYIYLQGCIQYICVCMCVCIHWYIYIVSVCVRTCRETYQELPCS